MLDCKLCRDMMYEILSADIEGWANANLSVSRI